MDEFVLRRPFLTERAEGDPDLVQRVGAIHHADGFLGCWEEAMHAAFDEVFQHEPAFAAEMLAGDADVVAQARPHGGDAEPVGAEEGFAGGAHGVSPLTIVMARLDRASRSGTVVCALRHVRAELPSHGTGWPGRAGP